MAALVIQFKARHGRLSEFVKSRGEQMAVGRGLSNDLVLSDPYVAQEQLQFFFDNEHWKIRVLDRLNPVLINGNPSPQEDNIVHSGDQLIIGRTHLTLFLENHPVEATRRLVLSKLLNQRWCNPFSLMTLLGCLGLLQIFADYLGITTTVNWSKLASNALVLVFIVLSWAGLWALIGRLLRHQPQFCIQLFFTILIYAVAIIVSPLFEYIEYMSYSETLGGILQWMFILTTGGVLLRFNLTHATNLHRTSLIAFTFIGSLMLFIYFISRLNEAEFSSTPQYSAVVKPPFAQITASETIDEFLQRYARQFRKLDNERSE